MTLRLHPVLASIAALSLAGAANASVVTFDDLPVSGNAIQTFVSSDGFDFNGGHFHIIDSPDSRVVDNGTQFLAAEAANGLGKAVTMTQVGGGLFSLDGLDVAEVWRSGESLNDFFQVSLTGNQFGGGVLSMLVTLDGIADGPGGANDFQTVALGGWTNLMSVTITGINLGMGGPTSVKAFLMIMIGGAGVISGAIAGGFILGMMESIGLTVLAAYGDVTYLVIFVTLMIFLAIRPQGLMGKPWG